MVLQDIWDSLDEFIFDYPYPVVIEKKRDFIYQFFIYYSDLQKTAVRVLFTTDDSIVVSAKFKDHIKQKKYLIFVTVV